MDAKSTGPRCDRCGAAAKWRYILGLIIWDWCGHHAEQYRPALEPRGFEAYELAMSDVRDVGARAKHGV